MMHSLLRLSFHCIQFYRQSPKYQMAVAEKETPVRKKATLSPQSCVMLCEQTWQWWQFIVPKPSSSTWIIPVVPNLVLNDYEGTDILVSVVSEWQRSYILGLVNWWNDLWYIIKTDRGRGRRRAQLSALISHTGKLAPSISSFWPPRCSSLLYARTHCNLQEKVFLTSWKLSQLQVGPWLNCCLCNATQMENEGRHSSFMQQAVMLLQRASYEAKLCTMLVVVKYSWWDVSV